MRVTSLHRYPVKSMLGEAVDAVAVDAAGLAGDRQFALIDAETGLVASAKQPRRWGRLLQCSATAGHDGTVVIDVAGRHVAADDPAVDAVLSAFVERPVTLSSSPPAAPRLERWWPPVGDLAPADVIARTGTVTPMAAGAPGTFFDYAPVHLVTTSSLAALRARRAGSDFAPARFRPNIMVETPDEGFVENLWAGRRLALGDEVILEVITPTPRCAVPSVAHGDLPADLGVLRGVVSANRLSLGNDRFACVGVYASVVQAGALRGGDSVTFL